jgi:hypothetical protein
MLIDWLTENVFTDYKTLSQMNNLSPADRKLVQQQLLSLTPRIKTAQEKEVGDMMGKLKEVCLDHFFVIWVSSVLICGILIF